MEQYHTIPNGGDYGANHAVSGNDKDVKDPALEMIESVEGMESMKKSEEVMEPVEADGETMKEIIEITESC